jgi:sporulation protein YlmC with PRC-barrel domain
MYVTDLRGLQIISLMSAFRMGTVEDALLDPTCRYVAALAIRTYGPGKRQYVLRQSVQRIGRHAVILGGSDEAPEDATLDNSDRLVSLRALIGLEVVSDQGNLLGRVRNAVIDPSTLAIEAYEIAPAGLGRLRLRAPLRVNAAHALSASKDVLIFSESALVGDIAPVPEATTDEPGAPDETPWMPATFDGRRDETGAALGG